MLAYVFWHWPMSDVEPARYDDDLRAFHAALAQAAPAGFVQSRVFHVGGEAPWLGARTQQRFGPVHVGSSYNG